MMWHVIVAAVASLGIVAYLISAYRFDKRRSDG